MASIPEIGVIIVYTASINPYLTAVIADFLNWTFGSVMYYQTDARTGKHVIRVNQSRLQPLQAQCQEEKLSCRVIPPEYQ